MNGFNNIEHNLKEIGMYMNIIIFWDEEDF